MASPAKVVDPPFYAPPITDSPTGQQHSQAWTEHNQNVADQINSLLQQVADLQTATAAPPVGVTDGSDAAAGEIGEYLSASGSGGLTSAAPADRATLTLPAGDWDVAGSAQINPSISNATFAQAWLGTAANTPSDPGRASIQSGGAGTLGVANLVVGPVRFSSAASVTVHLGCQANFPGGTTVSASAFIRARRVR